MGKISFVLLLLLHSLSLLGASFVDLGKEGNSFGKKRFKSYLAKKNHCTDPKDGFPKILITGFGPFKKRGHNTSALVLEKYLGSSLDLSDESFGGEVTQTTKKINGIDTHLCFLKLEVMWDLSSAIIATETENFQPDLVLMMGEGSEGTIIIETSAKSTASKLNGYNFQGEREPELNTPKSFSLLHKKSKAKTYENMTWDAQGIFNETISMMQGSPENFILKLAPRHRKKNIYICNAVSFTTLHALNNKPLYLFDDKLVIKSTFNKEIKAGFLHLPKLSSYQAESDEIMDFLALFLEKAISVHL